MDEIAWLNTWVDCINASDYEGAAALFDPHVRSFGTFADRLENLDQLIGEQWKEIWPHIADFRFDMDHLQTSTSPDNGLVVIAALWRSLGLAPDGSTFERRGRASIVLRRTPDGRLLAVHSHLSMSKDQVARAEPTNAPPSAKGAG